MERFYKIVKIKTKKELDNGRGKVSIKMVIHQGYDQFNSSISRDNRGGITIVR